MRLFCSAHDIIFVTRIYNIDISDSFFEEEYMPLLKFKRNYPPRCIFHLHSPARILSFAGYLTVVCANSHGK